MATPSPPSRSAQKSSASGEATRETMRCTMPGPGRPGIAPGYSKNVRSAPALPELVGVEQVVDARIVLVDGLLDHPQAEDAGVEIDVPGGVARDRRDVVDAFKPHEAPIIATAIRTRVAYAAPGSGNESSPSSRVRRSTNSLSSASDRLVQRRLLVALEHRRQSRPRASRASWEPFLLQRSKFSVDAELGPPEALAEALERVLGAEEVAARPDLGVRRERERVLVEGRRA